MLTYTYKAKNIGGNEFSGQMQGASRREVIVALKQKGFYILAIEPLSKASALFASNTQFGKGISVKDKAVFTHQLAILLKAGMKLTTALKTLSTQTKNKNLRAVISQINNDIEQSCSLSEAMAKHSKVFSRTYTAIIEAAEHTGSMSETLFVLDQQLKKQASVNSRIVSALIYPAFLLAVSILVIAVLMGFVIPKFIELFVNANQSLPAPTKILMVMTGIIKKYWWSILLILSATGAILASARKNKKFRIIFDSLTLNLPMAGKIIRKIQTARFSRTLGSLLKGGVLILKAVDTAKGATNNTAFRTHISAIEEKITKGYTMANAMKEQEYFGEMTVSMVAVGEETAMLPEMLLEIAEMYDNESENAINSITTLLGPLMILILGLLIGFVVLAILMPIFETSTIVG